MREVTKADLLYIYDFGLKDMLKQNGIPFLFTGLGNDGKRLWIFPRSERTQAILKAYTGK